MIYFFCTPIYCRVSLCKFARAFAGAPVSIGMSLLGAVLGTCDEFCDGASWDCYVLLETCYEVVEGTVADFYALCGLLMAFVWALVMMMWLLLVLLLVDLMMVMIFMATMKLIKMIVLIKYNYSQDQSGFWAQQVCNLLRVCWGRCCGFLYTVWIADGVCVGAGDDDVAAAMWLLFELLLVDLLMVMIFMATRMLIIIIVIKNYNYSQDQVGFWTQQVQSRTLELYESSPRNPWLTVYGGPPVRIRGSKYFELVWNSSSEFGLGWPSSEPGTRVLNSEHLPLGEPGCPGCWLGWLFGI